MKATPLKCSGHTHKNCPEDRRESLWEEQGLLGDDNVEELIKVYYVRKKL